MSDNDIPFCDVCEKIEATSVTDGIYRCETCEAKHLRLASIDPRDADPVPENNLYGEAA